MLISCLSKKNFDISQPFNYQKCGTHNLSLKYPYIIQQTGGENTQVNPVKVVILIQH